MACTDLQQIFRYLPAPVQEALQKIPTARQATIQEVRLRVARPVALSTWNQETFLMPSGGETTIASQAISINRKQLADTFAAICEYSVYRYTHEICDGFITVAGGNRVGIAGSAVYKDGKLSQIRHISSLNFRVSHAVTGCAETLYRRTFGVMPCSILIAGGVGAGKTTILRDFCRIVGNHHRVTLVDERSEIAAMYQGTPRYDIGLHTDVLDGFPRAEGLLTALRVMTPAAVLCDEIGTQADAAAILGIHGCGVPIIATAHGTSKAELVQRNVLQTLLQAGVFRYLAFVGQGLEEVIQDA